MKKPLKKNLPKYTAYGVLILFMSLLAMATFAAYTRGYSGGTGLDMSKVQKMRTDTAKSIAEKR